MHQERAEDMKKFLIRVATSYNAFASNLSRASSSALASIHEFASTSFIALRHEEVDLERDHILLKRIEYHNRITNEVGSQPVFGLGIAETIKLIRSLMESTNKTDNLAPVYVSLEEHIKRIFLVEKNSARLLERCDDIYKRRIIQCAFASEPPMIPVSGDAISRYRGGVPREKLEEVLGLISPNNRQDVLGLAIEVIDWLKCWPFHDAFSGAAQYFMHNKDSTSNIMKDVWRKWDIKKDCPFPEGVERMWNEEAKKSELLYEKTRLPYVSLLVWLFCVS